MKGQTMAKEFIRRSLELTAEQWEALDRLAEEHQTLAPTGPTAGKPNWRSLIKEIAAGRLTLTRKDDSQ